MTYSIQIVTGVADVPGAIAAFAAARGWGNPAAGQITNPVTGLTTTITSTGNDTIDLVPAGGPGARARMPWLAGTYPGSPDVSIPSRVHLFGNNAPYAAPDSEPFIACVVECGFNQYRHLFIGSMVKAGNYTDGDVISANNHATAGAHDYYDYTHQFLFRGYQNRQSATPGGVKITHAENPTFPWRKFNSGINSNFTHRLTSMTGEEIFGGNGDGINDGYVLRGHGDYAASQILTPVNLYCPNGADGADYRIRPLGHVPGVRLVDMKNLEPGQQVAISADLWRVFPEFSKRPEKVSEWSSAWGTYPLFETSYNLGLAYRE